MIVVFGSLNADLVFSVDALPRPGETVLCPGHQAVAGGKGLNQAVAAARANMDPAVSVQMVGRVGPDGFAPLALQALKDAGVGTEAVTESTLPTGCAAVIVDRAGENQITVASGANTDLWPEALPDEWLGPETVLLLQMEVPLDSNWDVARRAKARGARVVLNLAPAKPAPADVLPSFDLVVLNEIEAGMLAGAQGLEAGSGEEAGRGIAARFGVTTVVSLGSAGAAAFAPDEAWRCGALAIEPVDTVGAGDAFVAGLALGLAEGAPLPAMLRRASVIGSLACLVEGAAPAMPSAEEIEARLADLPPAQPLTL
ncbi:MAG: ribokinase [Rhodospirillales bacterium]|nr:ribokinase [Rhodospirillales bacterium]